MAFLLSEKIKHVFKILDTLNQQKLLKDTNGDIFINREEIIRFLKRVNNNVNEELCDSDWLLAKKATLSYCKKTPSCEICPIKKFCSYYCIKAQREYLKNIDKEFTFIDLFCGAGGASTGFEQSGLMPVLAIDHEKNAIETYRFNRPFMKEEMIIEDDIQNIFSSEENMSHYIPNISLNPSIMMGGVPCQGFSNANRQRLIDDPRNTLYKYFVKAVSYLKPKVILMENVVGIQKVANQVIEDFKSIGYFISFRVLNSVNFGVPQNRKRVIFIGFPLSSNEMDDISTVNSVFNQIENKGRSLGNFNLKDALIGLRSLAPLRVRNDTDYESIETGMKIDKLMTNKNKYLDLINIDDNHNLIFNHKSRYNNDRDIEIFNRLPQGGKSDHPSIADIMPYKERSDIFKDKYYRLIPSEPCKTITAHMKFDCNMYIHPFEPRGLTVREAARIQSFPDDYIFTGTFQKLYEQVGNAVPPLMARTIAEVIINVLLNKEEKEVC